MIIVTCLQPPPPLNQNREERRLCRTTNCPFLFSFLSFRVGGGLTQAMIILTNLKIELSTSISGSLDHTLKFKTLFKVPYFSVRSPLLTVETRPGCDLCLKCTKWVPWALGREAQRSSPLVRSSCLAAFSPGFFLLGNGRGRRHTVNDLINAPGNLSNFSSPSRGVYR